MLLGANMERSVSRSYVRGRSGGLAMDAFIFDCLRFDGDLENSIRPFAEELIALGYILQREPMCD